MVLTSGRFLTLFLLHTAFVVHRRFVLSTNAIAHDFALTTSELGWYVTAHATALTVSKLVLGAASDRFQPKRLLLIPLVLLAASALLLSTTVSKSVLFFVVVCSAALQGAAWPVCVGYLQRWLDGAPMGLPFSVLSATTTVGGLALAAAAAAGTAADTADPAAAAAEDGWRGVAEKIGYTSLVLVVFSWMMLEEGEEGKKEEKEPATLTFDTILRSGAVWRLSALYGLAMMTRTIAETWLPMFTHDPSLIQYYFEIGGLIGSLASGAAVDAAARAAGVAQEQAARHLLCVTTSVMLIVTSWLVLALADTETITSAVYLAGLAAASGAGVYASINIACLACATMAPGGRSSGALTAAISFIAQTGSMAAGSPVAALLQAAGRAALAPALSMGVVVVAVVAWINKPFSVEEEKKKEE